MMVFNPEDEQDFGPHCRNCHRGSSRCAACHNTGGTVIARSDANLATAANNSASPAKSYFTLALTSNDTTNTIGSTNTTDTLMSWSGWSDASAATMQGFFKQSRTTDWASDWRTTSNSVAMGQRLTSAGVAANCSDDGFSWPHRTLGWKMLKDDLFGLNFDNSTWVGVGEERFDGATSCSLAACRSSSTRASGHTADPPTGGPAFVVNVMYGLDRRERTPRADVSARLPDTGATRWT